MLDKNEQKQLDNIKDLEEKLASAKYINIKRKALLELYKGLVNSKRVLPYILVSGITFSAFSLFYSIPFVKDTRKQNLWYKKEIDSNGNISVEEQYERLNNQSEISYISNWQEVPGGYYERKITTYGVKALNEEEIERFVMENDVSLNKVLGEPILSKIERKNNVPEEELNKDGYIRAIIYNENLEEYAYIEETTKTNNESTLLWVFLNAILNGGCYIYSDFKGKDKRREQINKLEDKYAPLDVENLTRRLEIRKETYNRLK